MSSVEGSELKNIQKKKIYYVWYLPNSRTNVVIKVVLDKSTNDARFPYPSILKIKESMTVSSGDPRYQYFTSRNSQILICEIKSLYWQVRQVKHFKRKASAWIIFLKCQHCEWSSLVSFLTLLFLQTLEFLGWILYSCFKKCSTSSITIYLYKEILRFQTHGALSSKTRETISSRPVARAAQAFFQNRLLTPTFQYTDSTNLVELTFPQQDEQACLLETSQRLQVELKTQESQELDPQRCATIPVQVGLVDCSETALL